FKLTQDPTIEPPAANVPMYLYFTKCLTRLSLSLFQAHIKFPIDYPYSPPTFRFLTKMWHPNIYENGDVCISILHPPVDDPQSGELPSERWNPTQNVRTILLSVISLLNEPNTFSPANVDASVMFRKWRDSKGKDKEYAEIIR
uniref:Ubiquitin conjugating enzyme E2 R2 n=1 Tax=Laticauda laticaudata TaxID=8630 RepID=A0A8C5RJ70_LATLA